MILHTILGIKHYLVDGGPTVCRNYISNYVVKTCKSVLNGIIVTHPDSDHIDGIIELLKDKKLELQIGPVVITEYFKSNKKGKQLIKVLMENREEHRFGTNLELGSNFTFYFEDQYPGIIFSHEFEGSTSNNKGIIFSHEFEGSTSNNKVKSSITSNDSSIITTWISNAGKPVVVLTGDAPASRILKALNSEQETGVNNGAKVNFFQVPHHGSFYNSSLSGTSMPPKYKNTIKMMVIFYIILKERAGRRLSDVNHAQILHQCIGDMLLTPPSSFSDEIITILNTKIAFEASYEISTDEFVFEKVTEGLVNVQKECNKCGSIQDVIKIVEEYRARLNPKGRGRLTASVKKHLSKKFDQSWKKISDIHSNHIPLINDIKAIYVSDFYKKFSAEIYYISSSAKYTHPHPATVSGIFKAAIALKKKCKLLLSTGFSFPSQLLKHPDYSKWKELVSIHYFTQYYCEVNCFDNEELSNTGSFNRETYDEKILEKIHDSLASGTAHNYYNSPRSSVCLNSNNSNNNDDTERNLSEFLNEIGVSNITFSNMALLMADSYSVGYRLFTSIPLSLIQKVASWKVDDSRTEIQFTPGQVIKNANIFATVPNSSLNFGEFQLTVHELSLKYPSFNKTYHIKGKGLLGHSSSSKMLEVNFTTTPQDKTTPEISFELETSITLSDYFSFLKLQNFNMCTYVPFLGVALEKLQTVCLGLSLKQGIRDSADTYYLNSLTFSTQVSNWSHFLPNDITAGGNEFLKGTFLILMPSSEQPLAGFEVEFSTCIGSKKSVQLHCKASILPTETTERSTQSGYTCLLKFSQRQNDSVPATLQDMLDAIPFVETAQQLITELPVIKSLMEYISLKELHITYNTATKDLISLYLQVYVCEWKVIGEFIIKNFELELQYSEGSGWEAHVQSDVFLSKHDFVTIIFSLPTSVQSGELSLRNTFQDLTVNKVLKLLGLTDYSLPLTKIPILDSILNVTIKEATLDLETDFSPCGLKLEFDIPSLNIQIFELTDVEIILACKKVNGECEIAYSVSGFINELVHVKLSYDPSESVFSGHLEVANFKTSIIDIIQILTNETPAKGTIYDDIAEQTAAEVNVKLSYDRNKKGIQLCTFSIALVNTFKMPFGNSSLGCFFVQYTKKEDNLCDSERKLELEATLLQEDGQFGMRLSFVIDDTMTATINSMPGKKVSVRSFLHLAGLDSLGSRSPSDEYLDLEIESGCITFTTKSISSFEVTAALATDKPWKILEVPNIELSKVKLCLSYKHCDGENEVKAVLSGAFAIGDTQIDIIDLSYHKNGDSTTFHFSTDFNSMEIMKMILPEQSAALPKTLHSSTANFELLLSPEKKSFKVESSIELDAWFVDLDFVQQLKAILRWEQSTNNQPECSLKIYGRFRFSSSPIEIELDVCSTDGDTILQANISNPSNLDLSSITDDSHSCTDLDLPKYMPLSSAYLQINFTKKLAFLFGDFSSGTCLLIAGILKNEDSVGYAVTLTLPKLSIASFPDYDIPVHNVTASISNLDDLQLTDLVEISEKNLASKDITFPFKDLSISNILLEIGVSVYCELSFADSSNQLLNNMSIIQQDGQKLSPVTLYAHFGAAPLVFKANIPSLNLFGRLNFENITLHLTLESGYELSLNGDIRVQQVPSVVFHGDVRVSEDKVDLNLRGDKCFKDCNMFGIVIDQLQLSGTYIFKSNKLEIFFKGIVSLFENLSLEAEIYFKDNSLSLIAIALKTVNNPLTLSSLCKTVFGRSWDKDYIDFGLYDGEMYYATKDVNVDEYQYKSGFHICCKTFLFNESHVFRIDLSLTDSGFTASASSIKPYDFGFIKLSTGDLDENQNFLDQGPTLKLSLHQWKPDISLSIGLTIFDVRLISIVAKYEPPSKFILKATYPGTILVRNPSITFSWSMVSGFNIESWNLGPDIPGFLNKVKELLLQAIINFILGEIEVKFSVKLCTTEKTEGDMLTLAISGKCQFIVRDKNFSLELPNIIIHIPHRKEEKMADYMIHLVVDNIISNVPSIIKDILARCDYLGILVSALNFTKLMLEDQVLLFKDLKTFLPAEMIRDNAVCGLVDFMKSASAGIGQTSAEIEKLASSLRAVDITLGEASQKALVDGLGHHAVAEGLKAYGGGGVTSSGGAVASSGGAVASSGGAVGAGKVLVGSISAVAGGIGTGAAAIGSMVLTGGGTVLAAGGTAVGGTALAAGGTALAAGGTALVAGGTALVAGGTALAATLTKEPETDNHQKTDIKDTIPEAKLKDSDLEEAEVKDPDPEVDVKDTDPVADIKDTDPEVDIKDTDPEVDVKDTNSVADVKDVKDTDPEVDVKDTDPVADVKDPDPEVDVKDTDPVADIKNPDPEVDVKDTDPEADVEDPDPEVDIKNLNPEVDVKDTDPVADIKDPDPDPVADIKDPDPEDDVKDTDPVADIKNLDPEVDVKDTDPVADTEDPDPEVDIKNEVDVKDTDPVADIKDPDPEVDVKDPDVKNPNPEANIKNPDPEGDIKNLNPDVDVKDTDQEADIKGPDPDADVKDPDVKNPNPEADIKDVDPNPEVDVKDTDPEASMKDPNPEDEIKDPDIKADIEDPNIKDPNIKDPDPELEANIKDPDPEGDIKGPDPNPEADIKDPSPEADIKDPSPEADIKDPSPEADIKDPSPEAKDPSPEAKDPNLEADPEADVNPDPDADVKDPDVKNPNPEADIKDVDSNPEVDVKDTDPKANMKDPNPEDEVKDPDPEADIKDRNIKDPNIKDPNIKDPNIKDPDPELEANIKDPDPEADIKGPDPNPEADIKGPDPNPEADIKDPSPEAKDPNLEADPETDVNPDPEPDTMAGRDANIKDPDPVADVKNRNPKYQTDTTEGPYQGSNGN